MLTLHLPSIKELWVTQCNVGVFGAPSRNAPLHGRVHALGAEELVGLEDDGGGEGQEHGKGVEQQGEAEVHLLLRWLYLRNNCKLTCVVLLASKESKFFGSRRRKKVHQHKQMLKKYNKAFLPVQPMQATPIKQFRQISNLLISLRSDHGRLKC